MKRRIIKSGDNIMVQRETHSSIEVGGANEWWTVEHRDTHGCRPRIFTSVEDAEAFIKKDCLKMGVLKTFNDNGDEILN